MPDLPFMQFFPGDWIRDTRVLTASAKGAWIDLICAMWTSPEPGVISLRLSAFGRLIGLPEERTAQVLDELAEMGVCDRQDEQDGRITLRCRRVARDYAAASEARADISSKRSEAAQARWAKQKGTKGNANASAIADRMECSPDTRSQNIGEREIAGAGIRRPTLDQAKAAAPGIGVTPEMAADWWHAREASDWVKATGGGGTTRVGANWQADLKTYSSRMGGNPPRPESKPQAPEKFSWEK